MLQINQLEIRYQDAVAVQDFSLALEDGEIISLVGPTGCGKSSVLRAVAGLEPVTSGSIMLDGMLIDREHFVPPEQRGCGLVFQDFALFPHLSVAQNIGFRVKHPEQVETWLQRLGLEPHRNAMPATLSGGQKQRVALARTLMEDRPLVLLDEPFSALDAGTRAEMQELSARHLAGRTVLMVTHDPFEAARMGHAIAILSGTGLEAVTPPAAEIPRPVDDPETLAVQGRLLARLRVPA